MLMVRNASSSDVKILRMQGNKTIGGSNISFMAIGVAFQQER